MRIIIEESAIDNFGIIEKIASNKKICSVSFLDIHADIDSLIASLQALSHQRPKLKKVAIYTTIYLKNLDMTLTETACKQILNQYIHGIGWDDLQHISFFEMTSNHLDIHIIFNRVTPEGKLIDLSCLGASWKQYELLQKSCSQAVQWHQEKVKSLPKMRAMIGV